MMEWRRRRLGAPGRRPSSTWSSSSGCRKRILISINI
uniref:Uncharacterized protein n=1 Tax=Arundo donax TaxID=35708 RepID=A0A0A9D2I3_ARUDO